VIGWRFSDPIPDPLRDALEQLAAERRRPGVGGWMPVNVFEEGGAVVVTAAMPGVRPEDVELQCNDNVLTIRGRAELPQRQYLHQEMGPARYQRQIALPGDCRFEDAEAVAENGVLMVRVPKVRPAAPEKIRIQVNRKDSEPGKGRRSG
jgi:HSP20 family protein